MSATERVYFVYAYGKRDEKTLFQAVKLPVGTTIDRVHQAIADYENNEERSGRRWKTTIEAGCFNLLKVPAAENAGQAIDMAQEQGLQYEAKPVVLTRYREENQRTAESVRKNFERAGIRTGTSNPKDGIRNILDDLFGTSGPKF